ncbi:MAG: PD-(D/E)XK nuclease family protein [Clostridia bacterium]|nr:PD-(D/E)XK nuclease family protein [Clostridia bacterium]
MLHLICGPSGSGKTARLTDLIRKDIEAGTPCLLLVPEQQVYTSEMTLPSKLPSNAGLYLEILSFTGLSEKLFKRFGGLQFLDADRGVRTLVMWSALRSLSPILSRYGRKNATEESVVNLMQRAVEDLRANGIRPEQLQSVAEGIPEDPNLQKKLSDLALVSSMYSERMKAIFGENIPDERLIRLSKKLSENIVFSGTHIYVDSFTSFTWDENLVLKELIKQSKDLTIALCTDALPSSLPHFKSVSETGKSLKKLADEADMPWDVTCLDHLEDGSDLSYLEKNLWKFGAQPYSGNATHVRAVTSATVFEECEAAAINILDLSHKGIRFDEIAVIVRDPETYRGWLDAALERHKIPYFLSERNNFSQKPLARLILSALQSVLYGYRTTDVFSILKTGLSGISFHDASLFEEYVETWHITGKGYIEKTWSMNPDGLILRKPNARGKEILESANRVKEALILPLQELAAAFGTCKTFSEYCEALYSYLLRIDLPKTLENRSKEELERASIREANESVRLFGFLTELLGKAKSVLGEEEISPEEFLAVVSLLFSTADLGAVPLSNDCVTLGSASMLRLENVRATILLGLCEGEFPGDIAEGGILSEEDKEKLCDFDLHFRSRADIKQSEELFYVYRAVTKPTDAVILSYPKALDTTGKNEPSIAYLRVCSLLKLNQEAFDKNCLKPLSGYFTDTRQNSFFLPPADQNQKTFSLSPSAMEKYVDCPYSYHLSETLKLREEKDSLQGASESGNFFHSIFESFLSSKKQDENALREIVENYINSLCGRPMEEVDAQLLHQFFRLSKIAKRMLYDNDGILKELRDSGFRPIAFEEWENYSFPIDDQRNAIVNGKIDRVDRLDRDGKVYLRVVDYKSSSHAFVPADIPTGKEIQLVFYLMAVSEKYPDTIGAGGMYLWPEEKDGALSVGRSQFSVFESDPKKVCTPEDIQHYQDDLKEAVKQCALEILSGNAEKRPSNTSCALCSAKYSCDVAMHPKKY